MFIRYAQLANRNSWTWLNGALWACSFGLFCVLIGLAVGDVNNWLSNHIVDWTNWIWLVEIVSQQHEFCAFCIFASKKKNFITLHTWGFSKTLLRHFTLTSILRRINIENMVKMPRFLFPASVIGTCAGMAVLARWVQLLHNTEYSHWLILVSS